ncbi:MAG: ankyrin repeat domain-containing protein [Candidatus Binatia bacterium]
MDNTYFGFRTSPFSITASPQFFYENPLYREARLSLLFSLRQFRRLLLLTGSPGTGKTTLLCQAVSQLTPGYQTLYVPRCPQTSTDLLVTAGRYRKEHSLPSLLTPTLGEILKLCYHGKERAFVILDDAHNLSDEALTALNLLLNLETLSAPLLTLVLAGDSSLETRLRQPFLSDLQKRIDLHLRLHSLQPEEIDSYIVYRVRTAGSTKQDLFSPEAVQRITHYSKGVPRLINLFCDNALQAAYLAGMRTVSARLVDNIAQELFFAETTGLTSRPSQIPVVVLPDRQSTPQPTTYPVVLKQGTKHLTWITLTILVAWFALFQLPPPLQLTHDEVLPRNAQSVITSVAPSEQPPQLENEASTFASVSHFIPQQEPRTEKAVPSSTQAAEPRENRIAQASGSVTVQQLKSPSPTLVLAHHQQSSATTPQQSRPASVVAPNSSPITARISQQDTAQMQLTRLGIAATHATLLHSVERGDMHVTRLLLTAGIPPNARDNQGWTPLMFAARGGRQDLALLLIAHGAQVNAKNKTKGTALMLAAMNNHIAMAETLISKGAHINTKNSQGWTALTYASWKGHSQVVTALLNKGANTQVKDNLGWTPRQYAAWRQETRSKQEQLYAEIAETLGINLKNEPLTAVSHSDYRATSDLLSLRTEIH